MATHDSQPLNKEPPIAKLMSSFITSEGYDRNHGPLPSAEQLDEGSHQVLVDGFVHKTLSLSIADPRDSFPQHEVVCALQCAGNRRHDMRTTVKEVDGIDWLDGAVMNCRWRGPTLKDILNRAGINLETSQIPAAHVAFASEVVECEKDLWYGASIPLERALDMSKEVVLALERNGRPLDIRHGFPVRVIVPGVAGARAVKWLDRITVQLQESNNFYMQRDYKALPPDAKDGQSAEPFWATTPPVQEMPVNSVISHPRTGDTVKLDASGRVECRGYALPGGDGGPVVKVEVSTDRGKTWTLAEIENHGDDNKWTWVFWKASVVFDRKMGGTIHSRATDALGNTQPEDPPWNLRGVCYNGYGEAKDLKFA
ncbi:putative sulfite oxidase [Microdochium trichocladiopsis]|uniref:Sulfite oxidase n=1 Tax=Microdochium trichocladiopsis TaxID=1682393 RepID=A0A9P8XWV3_9PEZI|nr:putative sulfite oxidase [Microdochium trichocladiopsis]KAH7021412.1 putative sulfite oxidase [Microdochium trichocladiopsis]